MLEAATRLPRFEPGGSTVVRGYSQEALAPTDILGVPTGGDGLLLLTQELRLPLAGGLGVAAFVDAGNLFARVADMSLAELKVGAGVGLRYRLAGIVLRLDLGFPTDPGPADDRALVYFGLGQAF